MCGRCLAAPHPDLGLELGPYLSPANAAPLNAWADTQAESPGILKGENLGVFFQNRGVSRILKKCGHIQSLSSSVWTEEQGCRKGNRQQREVGGCHGQRGGRYLHPFPPAGCCLHWGPSGAAAPRLVKQCHPGPGGGRQNHPLAQGSPSKGGGGSRWGRGGEAPGPAGGSGGGRPRGAGFGNIIAR